MARNFYEVAVVRVSLQ